MDVAVVVRVDLDDGFLTVPEDHPDELVVPPQLNNRLIKLGPIGLNNAQRKHGRTVIDPDLMLTSVTKETGQAKMAPPTQRSSVTTMPIDILLLIALPASGKSELRRYMELLDPATALNDLRLGPTVQLDDYPYVHMMRRISQEVRAAGDEPVFFEADDQPFIDPMEWGTLMHLLNFDFEDLDDRPPELTLGRAAPWLFDRIDSARQLAGLPAALGDLAPLTLKRLESALEPEAKALHENKIAAIPENMEGKTIVMEMARGGPEGAGLPLPAPHGYQYSLSLLNEEILQRASILYVWVEPEESRRKNVERAQPGRDGDASILHHGVPEAVMRGEYGTDDLMYLLAAGGGSFVFIEKGHQRFGLPTGVFDNRDDLTSFLREDQSEWSQFKVRQLHRELVNATAGLRTRPQQ